MSNPVTPEDAFRIVLRWMKENVLVASGIYIDKDSKLQVNPSLTVDQDQHVQLVSGSALERAADQKQPLLNSPIALTCCCYISALGQVLTKGRANATEAEAFDVFLQKCMNDFVVESDAKAQAGNFTRFPQPGPRRVANPGTYALYKMFRCGFVHRFGPSSGGWVREGSTKDYWIVKWFPDIAMGREFVCINLDRLATGFLAGLERFQSDFAASVGRGDCTYDDFHVWLRTEK